MSPGPQLPRIPFGTTGWSVSRLALGGFHQVEMSSEVVAATVDAYLNAGGNYIETARSYGGGASEHKIGQALGHRRAAVHLVSKSTARDAQGIRRDLDASLEALGTDYLDVYFFHGVNTPADLNAVTGPNGALAGLERARDEGLVRGFGLSSHRPAIYGPALDRLPLTCILVWHNVLEDLYLPEIRGEIFPLARERGVAVTAMKPLADGFLYRSAAPALRYCLGTGAEVIVCGMNCPAHVHQAVDAIGAGPLDDAECEAFLREAPGLGPYVCRQCGRCSEGLMALFRLEGRLDRQMIDYLPHDPADYALRLRLSGWFGLADDARHRFRAAGWNEADLLAAATVPDCPYGIDIPRKTRLALAKLAGRPPQIL